MTNDELIQLVESIPKCSYRAATKSHKKELSPEMAQALGYDFYHTLPVLASVVDAIVNKLKVKAILSQNTPELEYTRTVLQANGWDNLQKDLFKCVVRDGDAYLLTTFSNGMPRYTLREAYDGYSGVYTFTDDEGNALYAVNIYRETVEEIKIQYLDIYFPDRIERYWRKAGAEWEHYDPEHWPIDWTDKEGNPLGIALVRFDIGSSDIDEAVQLQRWLNDAIVDLMAVSRTMGWPQRYMKGATNPEYLADQYGAPLVNAVNLPIRRSLKLTPGSIFLLQGKDVEFGQLDGTDPDTTIIDKLLHLISIITTVPTFHFNGSEFPSGVALIQAEARLNHLVENHQNELNPALLALLRLTLRLSNTFANTKYRTDTVFVIHWQAPIVTTPELEADLAAKKAQTLVALDAAGAVSTELKVRTAMALLNPNAPEEEIQVELARVNSEKPVLGI